MSERIGSEKIVPGQCKKTCSNRYTSYAKLFSSTFLTYACRRERADYSRQSSTQVNIVASLLKKSSAISFGW